MADLGGPETERATLDGREHGPYCALCGQCKACSEAGVQDDYGCYDRVEVDGTRRHLWNAEVSR